MSHPKIVDHRRSKPLEELKRKARKAKRRGFWTIEELDYSKAWGGYIGAILGQEIPKNTQNSWETL